MAGERNGAYAIDESRVATVDDGVADNLRQSDGKRKFRRYVVAEKEEARVEAAFRWQHRPRTLRAHRDGDVEPYHVVFAVKGTLKDASRVNVYTRPAPHHLRIVGTRTEADKRLVHGERRHLIAIEAAVAEVERRKHPAFDEHLLVRTRRKILEERGHGVHLVRNSGAVEQSLRLNLTVLADGDAVISLAYILAVAPVCNGKHGGDGKQDGISAVYADVILEVCTRVDGAQT